MKYIITLLISLLALFATSCDERVVLYAIPNTYSFVFVVTLGDGASTFNEVVVLDANLLRDKINEIVTGDITIEDIQDNNVEGLSYQLLFTDQPHAILNAEIKMAYQQFPVENIVVLEQEVLGNHLNVDDVVTLPSSGVSLLETALDDILINNLSDGLVFSLEGEVFPGVTQMVIQVDLDASHVVQQTVQVPNPL